MKAKNEFITLFVSYLMNELNAEEEAYVINALNSDPVLMEEFNAFENLWKLLAIEQDVDGINIEKELKHLKEMESAKKVTPIKNEVDLYIVKAEKQPSKGIVYRLGRPVAVAVSLLLLMGIGWLLFQNSKEKVPVFNAAKEVNRVKYIVRIEKNTSGKPRLILLEDGSEVLLWNQSELNFIEPFETDKRVVTLKGKAKFKVAKNKAKPFTVFSGDITTTAIGTEFLVTNFEKEQMIIVHLLEGKVMVKSVDSLKTKLNNDFYLLPGQEFLYNKRNATGQIRRFQKVTSKKASVNKEVPANENPSLPNDVEGSWYMFNNQSLPDIFDQLKSMFGVPIIYKRKEVEKLYFIGKFEKTDSLEYILRHIAGINKLTISKENNRYIIHK